LNVGRGMDQRRWETGGDAHLTRADAGQDFYKMRYRIVQPWGADKARQSTVVTGSRSMTRIPRLAQSFFALPDRLR
jgi:hypothetical protein